MCVAPISTTRSHRQGSGSPDRRSLNRPREPRRSSAGLASFVRRRDEGAKRRYEARRGATRLNVALRGTNMALRILNEALRAQRGSQDGPRRNQTLRGSNKTLVRPSPGRHRSIDVGNEAAGPRPRATVGEMPPGRPCSPCRNTFPFAGRRKTFPRCRRSRGFEPTCHPWKACGSNPARRQGAGRAESSTKRPTDCQQPD